MTRLYLAVLAAVDGNTHGRKTREKVDGTESDDGRLATDGGGCGGGGGGGRDSGK
jgi:hypothetical protein